jgi:hypothetical protein
MSDCLAYEVDGSMAILSSNGYHGFGCGWVKELSVGKAGGLFHSPQWGYKVNARSFPREISA